MNEPAGLDWEQAFAEGELEDIALCDGLRITREELRKFSTHFFCIECRDELGDDYAAALTRWVHDGKPGFYWESW